jgi:DNA repair exonuclease SbcCD ATPase subunit
MLNIKSVTFKNILSVGNRPVSFDFMNHKKTLIVGKNGQGKSILTEVITFALFGKPFRDIKKPQLVNNVNKKDLLVTINFSIKDTEYKIIRGIHPGIFEIYINDSLVHQDASVRDYQTYLEEEILNMNYRTFTQIVTLGSSNYIPFMKMPAGQKREIIEDILNISIFSRMNDILKGKIKDHEVSIQLAGKEKELAKKQYTFLFERFNQNKTSTDDRIKNKKDSILSIQNDIFSLESSAAEIEEKDIYDIKDLEAQKKKLEAFRIKIEGNLSRTLKEIKFYEESDKCLKCNTELTEEHKAKHINILTQAKDKFTPALEELNTRIKEIDEKLQVQREINQFNQAASKKKEIIQGEIKSLKIKVSYIEQEIIDITKESREIISDDEIQDLKKAVKDADISIQEKYKYFDVLKKGIHILKDSGAKTKIINFYLPMINNTVNSFLEKFNFNVLFSFNENFDESFKGRNIDSYSYGNFSDGEKLRLDLSILFAFREIAKRKNSASVNLLFIDEILDSGLDLTGIEAFFDVLSDTGKTSQENINFVVISHREGVETFFDRTVKASINSSGFTQYEEIS